MSEIKEIALIQSAKNNSNSTTKDAYIIVIEDPTTKPKFRSFFCSRVDEKVASVSYTGFEITDNSNIFAQLKSAKTYNDAVELAKRESELEILTIPWHKVISIKTFRYNTRSAT